MYITKPIHLRANEFYYTIYQGVTGGFKSKTWVCICTNDELERLEMLQEPRIDVLIDNNGSYLTKNLPVRFFGIVHKDHDCRLLTVNCINRKNELLSLRESDLLNFIRTVVHHDINT